MTVLDAERTLHASEMALVGAEQDAADADIARIKALGGDWTNTDPRPDSP